MADVAQFCEITGSTPEQASFFLSMHNNNVEAAVAGFFEHAAGGGGPAAMTDDDIEEVSAPAPASVPSAAAAPQRQPPPAQAPPPAKRSAPAKGNVRSLSDFNKGNDDGDSEDEPTEWFTGGQKSGQMVQDPTKRGAQGQVESIFDRAREHGALQGKPEDLQRGGGGGGGGFSAFKGAANKLSGDAGGEAAAAQPAAGAAAAPPESVTHVITFYNNGFTVDDGPFRPLDDPANEPFLSAIGKGHCPRELEPPSRSTLVNINLVRKEENYVPPPEPKYKAFSGAGTKLGGGSSSAAAAAAPPPAPATSAPAGEWSVDESKPQTKIQIRLSDGQRVVGIFNLDHTVGDIRRFIASVRPGGVAAYTLKMQDRPPKVLADDSETIEAAKLANAVVLQEA